MRAPLRDRTVLQHNDLIRMPYRADPVGDNDLRRPLQFPQRLLDHLLRLHIQRRGGIVQHQDRIPLGQCPCNADPLFLSAGQPHAPFPDHGVVSLLHTLDKITGLGLHGSPADRLEIQPFLLAQLNIVIDGIREKEHILHHVTDAGAQLLQGQLFDVHTIQINGSLRRIIHTLQKLYNRSLARSRGPHNAQRPARFHRKGNIMQDLVHVRFVEGHMVETDLTRHLLDPHRLSVFRDGRLLLIDLTHLLIGCHRRRKAVGQPSQHFHRPDDIRGILHESGHLPQRHLSFDHESASDQYGQYRQYLADHTEKGIVPHKNPGLLHVQFIVALIVGKEFPDLMFFPRKSLYGTHTGQILLRHRI